MQFRRNWILGGTGAVLALAALVVWIVRSRTIPEFNVAPVPQNAPTLNEADIEKVLGVEKFRIFRRVHQVPIVVQQSFSNFMRLPFDLVDPGEQICSDDLSVPAKSCHRLVFLGLSEDSAVLAYEQGGFASTYFVVICWFDDGGRGWVAALDGRPNDIASLKSAVQEGRFRTLAPPA
jgi:hypothetical protein